MPIYQYVIEQLKDINIAADKWTEYLLDEHTDLCPEEWEYVYANAMLYYEISMGLFARLSDMAILPKATETDGVDSKTHWEGLRLYRENRHKWSRVIFIMSGKTGRAEREIGLKFFPS